MTRYIYFRTYNPEVVTGQVNPNMRSADPNRRKRKVRVVPNQSRLPQQSSQERRALPPGRSVTYDQVAGSPRQSRGGQLAVRNAPVPPNQNRTQVSSPPPRVPNTMGQVSNQSNKGGALAVRPNMRGVHQPRAPIPRVTSQNNGGFRRGVGTGQRNYTPGQLGSTRYVNISNRLAGRPQYQQSSPMIAPRITNTMQNVNRNLGQDYTRIKQWVKQKGLGTLDLLNKAYRRVVR